ncbi:MAG TPA: DoxX family protein [Armatimonadota bacterium]|nr:DoxX family protein [Armatimonadota bacterium]HOM81846.1 DoxX family protein [Armatimonadota bacterium]
MMRGLTRALLATREENKATLPLRIPLAMIFVAHGAQKLFGWFGGHGLDATIEGFESLGIPPGLTKLAATTEFLGGLGVLTGFLTRPAALGIATVMAVATAKVHWQHGFFVNWGNQPGRGHGIEATMALAGMALSLVISGGGALSVDAALTHAKPEEKEESGESTAKRGQETLCA